MRHETWLKVETSPFWHRLYLNYRILPDGIRAPLRWLLTPRWEVMTFMVRTAARGRVVAGPFRGMRVELSALSRRHLLGYILGSQEPELHDAIDHIIARRYRTVLNIGAADGYYTVGLALRLPETRVAAFEALPEFHAVIARTAAANGVADRIAINGLCTVDLLRDSLERAGPRPLVVMDVEGGEIDLLDPLAIPQLRTADILVETHDMFVPGVTETVADRFRATHAIESYVARPRLVGDFPDGFLPVVKRRFPRLAADLMNERRIGLQRWLFMTADAAGGGAKPAGDAW